MRNVSYARSRSLGGCDSQYFLCIAIDTQEYGAYTDFDPVVNQVLPVSRCPMVFRKRSRIGTM